MEPDATSLLLLGLTEYEARAYRALLQEYPATAYRLGRRSGVPLSRVYEVANRLVDKGAAILLEGEPARYAPVAPEILIKGARQRLTHQLDMLQAQLTGLLRDGEPAGHGWIRGEQSILSLAEALVADAKEEVALAAPPAVQRLWIAQAWLAHTTLTASPGREAHIRILTLPPGALSGRGFVLLVDNTTALIGRFGPDADALLIRHPVIVGVCAEYIRMCRRPDTIRTTAMHSSEQSALPFPSSGDWLSWEEEKQRRLLRSRQIDRAHTPH